ncbi:MAG: beta-propeller domain-containing protein [Clostridiaceae bacterium]|nr:beta-propeller domain-containing protein [Clostridiaceae bacterium]
MMKLDSKAVRVCLVCFLAVCIALPVLTFAKDDTFIELPERLGTSPEIAIEVPFDSELMAATVSKGNVYVTDDQGIRIPVNIKTGSDWKSIIVEPVEQYEAGKNYTLYIRSTVKYTSGSRLKDGFKLKFTIAKAAEEPLPVVGSGENLRKLLEEAGEQDYYFDDYGVKRKNGVMALDSAAAAPASAANESTSNAKRAADSGSGDYSTTNVQVEGVDEADIVKTDGKYLYQVNNDRIVVAEIYPSDKMKIKKIIELEKENVYPMELYLDDKYLVLIGTSNNAIPVYRSEQNSIMPEKYPYYNNETVKLIAYDITDKSDIKKVREIELEGSYLSSRKIDSKLYLVSNKGFNYRRILEDVEVNDTPSYRDTAVKEEFVNIDYGKIGYFPESVEPNYMIVAGIDLDLPKEGVNVSTYLGSGESIYASGQNLYVAVTRHNIIDRDEDDPIIYDSEAPKKVTVKVSDRETVVYRFALNNGKLDYTGKGQVPGSILNQFSMDESEGFFRIATTKGSLFEEGEYTSKNNLYVMDPDLEICGRLEDVAPGEKIYSVRFMGDRAYMVTFKKVDPLFVIDLKDAKNPTILGALKIPGYSDYLHPYDENHIIGFGKDTIELSNEGTWKKDGTTAYYQGMKIALFDVSDVNNPKEKFKEIIGDRGTDSELLSDHKALLFSKDKELMAFPVTVMEIKDGGNISEGNRPVYGSFSFQGAYVYNVDLEEGFKLRARISHISEEEYDKSGDGWYSSNKNVERIIYIGDDLYTISKGMIKANSMTDMNEKGSLLIP